MHMPPSLLLPSQAWRGGAPHLGHDGAVPAGHAGGHQAEPGRALNPGELLDIKARQGRPHALCDLRIVDDQLRELPRDGQAVGNLEVCACAAISRATDALSGRSARTSHLGCVPARVWRAEWA